MTQILSYGCTTSAGKGADALFQSLYESKVNSKVVSYSEWPANAAAHWEKSSQPPKAFLIPGMAKESHFIRSVELLLEALREALEEASLAPEDRVGFIFATAKGAIEDFVWKEETIKDMPSDYPIRAILDDVIKHSSLKATKSICLSNACASSHAAFYLGKKWIDKKQVDKVVVLSSDLVGPFVLSGFYALGALSKRVVSPFSQDRDGLGLGEAAAAIILSGECGEPDTGLILEGVEIQNEITSVTKPSLEGVGLKKSIDRLGTTVLSSDAIIAHGTGTKANDEAETNVFSQVFPSQDPVITCTKWSVGHTLGASGALDVIAGCEVLKRQKLFSMGMTEKVSQDFRGDFLTKGRRGPNEIKRILVTSLGFGGTNGALLLGQGRGD